MLFNSPFFILFFLPITLGLYWAFRGTGRAKGAVNVLILASFFFYGWWDPRYLGLIGGGILFNYWVCRGILKAQAPTKKMLMIFGVVANLGLLAYFKYTDFFIQNCNGVFGTDYHLLHIILPLGISFFIFQKIAFLVDAYRGEFNEISLRQFTAFVIFFPQLIAGPIPKHNELFVQFKDEHIPPFDWECMALGITAFAIGLFKKTVVADGLALWASPFFKSMANGYVPTFIDSWAASISYTLQLYFDFSGYSDMAIGLALLFGYRLPVNFFSPYKAANIIDFWRRWHITLSRFLRDYLYISLGGNRKGVSRQKINLVLTMIIGGLWHGAAWTFVIWGMLHGLFLCLNHLWWELKEKLGISGRFGAFGLWMGRSITFLAIVISWVFFRADSTASAINILSTMFGFNGLTLNPSHVEALGPIAALIGAIPMRADFFWGVPQVLTLMGLLIFVWVAPNTYEYLNSAKTAILTYKDKAAPMLTTTPHWVCWKPSFVHTIIGSCIMGAGAWYAIRGGEFLYFQF